MSANEKIAKMNQIMYDVIEKDLLEPDGNIHGFFDLMQVGLTRSMWSLDGVHMTTDWYRAIMSYILETVCNSVREDGLTFH